MLRNIADFVVLTLTKRDDASYLHTSLRDDQIRVAWIDAPHLDAAQTSRFLERRLSVERAAQLAPGQELFPFTEGAVRELFAPTAGGQPITLSIGVVIRRLKGAFEQKCVNINAMIANPPPTGILPSDLRITDKDMRSYLSG